MALRERILAVGPPDTGKSYQWLRIARALRGATFRVIDTDDAISRMLSDDFREQDASNGGNVHVRGVYTWGSYMEASAWVLQESREGDWVVLDMADMAWSAAQRYFVNEVFGQEMGDYFLEARKLLRTRGDRTEKGKEAKKLETLKGWLDWVVINKMYDDFIMPLIYQCPAHFYATAKPAVSSEDDDKTTKDLFGPHGVKPAGQKSLGHQFHTVFLFTHRSGNEWEFTTIKDRERKRFDHAKLVSLYHQYLVPVAGYKP